RNLVAMVAARTFREDLYYRLNAIPIALPPLRERADDIVPLGEHFLAESSAEFKRRFAHLAPETAAMLRAWPWPGNVRELRAVVSRAVLLHDDELLRPDHLPAELHASPALPVQASTPSPGRGKGQGGEVSHGPIPTLAEV